MDTLAGKHVLVVGGASGIRLGIAKVAAQAGARVTIAARTADKLAKAAAIRPIPRAGPRRRQGL
jgi:NAD(P)-dependent dehydrogenase (short-subunit alcohol dehydrogenase family)